MYIPIHLLAFVCSCGMQPTARSPRAQLNPARITDARGLFKLNARSSENWPQIDLATTPGGQCGVELIKSEFPSPRLNCVLDV